jgi:hypothetical protein
MTKVNTNIDSRSNKYAESVTLRNEVVESCNVDFLDKIKAVEYLNDDMILTVDQVAHYYETSRDSVSTIIKRNRDEFEDDGMTVLTGQQLKDFKKSLEGSIELSKVNKSLILLTKRSLLRVGMIMTNNAMAIRIRNYLLNLEETATVEQKSWAIQREVGIIERKRMATAISKYLPESKNKKFAYPNYTNMIYKILFNKSAKEMRETSGLTTNDALRDTFTTEQLKLVEESETIVTALVALGFNYNQIKEQLERKYIKMIE